MTTRTGRRSARQTNPAVAALQWLWAAVLSLLLIAVGLALAFFGVVFGGIGVEAVLNPDDPGHAIAAVLFAVLGLAAAVGCTLLLWRRRRLVAKLSGQKPRSKRGSSGGAYFGGGGDGGGGCGGGDGGGGGGSC